MHRLPVPAARERVRRSLCNCLENGNESSGHRAAIKEGGPGNGSRLIIGGVALEEVNTPTGLDVLDGFVEVAGRRYANLVPLPFDEVGPVRVLLDGPQGVFEARATAAQLVLVGDARYVEEFPGAGKGA